MGEYARINQQIRDEEARIAELRKKLEHTTDESERENILETIYDYEISIGECNGALLEMADVDGLDDPYEAFDY